MKKLAFGLFTGLLALMLGLAWLTPAQASPDMQYTPFPTPTPRPDGRILYLVQEGDNLWWISSISGVSVDELRQLNDLGLDDVLISGTYILLGLAGPADPTTAPSTSGEGQPGSIVTPSPTPIMDSSEICVLLYLDANGDAIRQTGEIGMGDGEVSVTERLGSHSQKGTTKVSIDPITPLCFKGIPQGTYLVTMAIPEGYNGTTELNSTIDLVPGDTAYLNFGMQPSAANTDTDDPSSPNKLIGIIGVTLLVVGAGVGIYAATVGRSRFTEGD